MHLYKKIIYFLCVAHFFFLFTSCQKKDEDKNQILLTLTTVSPSVITSNSATSGGIIKNNGVQVIERGICFGVATSPTIANTKLISSSLSDTFSSKLMGLLPNSTYYVRAYATSSQSTVYGNQIVIQTLTTIVDTDSAVTIYVSSRYNKLHALNAWDGSIKWTVNLGGLCYSSPIYVNGTIYVGCSDNKLYAFDTIGNFKWSTAVPNHTYNQSPIVSSGIVYFSSDDATYALNADNGNLIWKFPVGSRNVIIKNNTIFINSRYLYAIDASTGIQKWKYLTATIVPPVVFDDRVYVINDVTSAFADTIDVINTKTGELIWGKGYSSLSDVIGMAVKNGNIYCSMEGINSSYGSFDKINMYDSATGTIKYSSSAFKLVAGTYLGYGDYINLVITDSLGFITSNFGNLYQFNAFNLQIISPSLGGGNGYTVVKNLIYSTNHSVPVYNPNTGTYYASHIFVTDYKTKLVKWTKEIKDVDFVVTAPCVVTKSGAVYRGGVISY